MANIRRLAKRSIIGTKVTAQWQDGWYYPGVIEDQLSDISMKSNSVFNVRFEQGWIKSYKAREIIGPGFQTTCNVQLKNGQKVFVTLHGREVTGFVLLHDFHNNDVRISVELSDGEITIRRKLEDVRLLESRKSPRLMDQELDYGWKSDLYYFGTKKDPVPSEVIDVPQPTTRHRYIKEVMDETEAAMVLTNLSCSPMSPQFSFTDKGELYRTSGDGNLPSSYSSSGFISGHSDHSNSSHSQLGESVPLSDSFSCSTPTDDDLDMEEELINENESDQKLTKTMYRCTWRHCDKIFSSCEAVVKHVRVHLGCDGDVNEMQDGEEEFYYDEIEVNVENMTKNFSNLMSPILETRVLKSNTVTDHDYLCKTKKYESPHLSASVPGHFYGVYKNTPSTPIDMPIIQRSLSWQNAFSILPVQRTVSRPSPTDRLQQHQSQSPKSHVFYNSSKATIHKKQRGDVRKCRKVYGMENRDMWCTQCKWKKACSRYTE